MGIIIFKFGDPLLSNFASKQQRIFDEIKESSAPLLCSNIYLMYKRRLKTFSYYF